MPGLLLQAGVAVPPIGAGLAQGGHFVGKGLPRLDSGETDAGHAVELERNQQSMPVDRAVFIQRVRHVEIDRLALFQTHQRPGNAAIDGNAHSAPTLNRNGAPCDREVDVAARHFVEALTDRRATHIAAARPGRNRGSGAQQAASRDTRAQKSAPIDCLHHKVLCEQGLPYPTQLDAASLIKFPQREGNFSRSVLRAR